MTDTSTRSGGLALLKRYGVLTYGAFGTMADVGLMVFAAISVGLAIAVLIGGFGLVNVTLEDLSTGEMLVSAIVLGVVGLFCLGVAAEGPLGRGRRLTGFQLWEVAIGRALAAVAVGGIGMFAYRLLSRFVEEVPSPILRGLEGLRATAVAGLIAVPLIAVPVSIGFRAAAQRYVWLAWADLGSLFVAWATAAFLILS